MAVPYIATKIMQINIEKTVILSKELLSIAATKWYKSAQIVLRHR